MAGASCKNCAHFPWYLFHSDVENDGMFQDCANRIKHAQHNGHNYFFSWEYELTKDLKVIDDDDDDDDYDEYDDDDDDCNADQVDWITGRNICRRHCMDLVSIETRWVIFVMEVTTIIMILAIVIVTIIVIVIIVNQGGEWVLEAENDQRAYPLLLDIWKVVIIIITVNVVAPSTVDIIKSIISAVKIGWACNLGFICVK